MTASGVPESSARLTSEALAFKISSVDAARQSAAVRRASFFSDVEAVAMLLDAAATRTPSCFIGEISLAKSLFGTSADYRPICQ